MVVLYLQFFRTPPYSYNSLACYDISCCSCLSPSQALIATAHQESALHQPGRGSNSAQAVICLRLSLSSSTLRSSYTTVVTCTSGPHVALVSFIVISVLSLPHFLYFESIESQARETKGKARKEGVNRLYPCKGGKPPVRIHLDADEAAGVDAEAMAGAHQLPGPFLQATENSQCTTPLVVSQPQTNHLLRAMCMTCAQPPY